MLRQPILRAQCLRDLLAHERRLAQRSQADPEDPRLEARHELRRGLDREPRLAGATRPGERDEPGAVPDQLDELVPFPLPADERRRGARKVRVRDRLQRRPGAAPELEEPDRPLEVLQPVLAELSQLAVDERPRRRRDDNLATVAGRGDPRGTVQLAAGIALARQQRLARMQAHPHLDGARLQRRLARGGGGQRLDRIGIGVEEGVALRVDLGTTMRGEGASQKAAVLGERLDVALLAELLDETRGAFDVREEEGDGRKLSVRHARRQSRFATSGVKGIHLVDGARIRD